jgi:D-amino-acid dehydrogenase
MAQSVVVIGGGVAGLMSAYYLQKAGHHVRVIDKASVEDNASFGNAGLLSAFEKTPLAHPGIIVKTLKLMLQGKSPMLINPTLDPKLYRWLVRFVASTTKERLKKSLILFEKYGHVATQAYYDFSATEGMEFDFHHDGVYLVFTDKKSFQEKLRVATNPAKYEIFSYEEAKAELGFVRSNVEGIIHLKRNARMNPGLMIRQLKALLIKKGVEFILNEEIVDLEVSNRKIQKALSRTTAYEADTFVLATGANIALAQKLGQDLMLTPAKGYSITFDMDASIRPKRCVMFNDLFIICTPRAQDVRLTSKLELGSTSPAVIQHRIDSIVKNLKRHTVDFELKNPTFWAGFRPLTPNDMPLIGRDPNVRNMVYAMGYGWLGITFGPVLGQIIAQLINEDWDNHQSDDVLLFSGFYQGCL